MTSVSADVERLDPPAAPAPVASSPRDGRRLLRRAAPGLLAAALAGFYLLWQPASIDLAAGDYRAWLFGREGLALWDLQWYGGHHMPGYSVLFPPLAWLLGARVAGALAVVACAVLFERIAHARYGDRALLGSLWFAAGTMTMLLSGRITFALGMVPALGALLALQCSRDVDAALRPVLRRSLEALALALGVACALASPVAALFLALAGVAWALGEERRPALRPTAGAGAGRRAATAAGALLSERRVIGVALAVAAMGPVLAMSVLFPEGGHEPFVLSAYWPVLAVAVLALVLLPRGERTLRIAVVLYALGCTAAYVLDTPVGGNAARLGALCAGPLFALVLWPRRKLVLALLVAPLLFWQWTAAYHDVRAASGDPTVRSAFYTPLNAFLDRQDARLGPGAGRVEIPFTKLHWEARHVAPYHPLARGWERQLDVRVNPVFYDGKPLTPARYRAWLDEMAVRWVALPDARFDYSARAEARLVAGGLPYLREVWHDADWRVYEVRDPTPLASGPARITRLGRESVTLAASAPGTVRLRMHWTPYWDVAAGAACVAPDGDFTRVEVRRAGEVRLTTRFALGRIAASSPRCNR
jgi:hypothetical protein